MDDGGQRPTPPTSTNAMNGALPERTAPGASMRSWKFGRVAHGAPVCFACESSVGTHGRYEHEHRDPDVQELAQPLAA